MWGILPLLSLSKAYFDISPVQPTCICKGQTVTGWTDGDTEPEQIV